MRLRHDPLACPDSVAERRYAYALAAAREADWRAAAEVLEQALELAPNWPPAWFALAEAREKLGDADGAAAAYRVCLRADPEDRQGAAARLAILGAAPANGLPDAYVERLFDDYAPRFEAHVLSELGYRGPQAMIAALDAVAPSRRFRRCLDLGCGTGLAGAAIRSRVDWLIGVDLSQGMIDVARRKETYDSLDVGEAVGALRSLASGECDLILAVDVLAYFGDLAPLFQAAARSLTPGGCFVFSIETQSDDGFRLAPTMRFTHAPAYVAGQCGAAGLNLLRTKSLSQRREAGRPVEGMVAVAGKDDAGPPETG